MSATTSVLVCCLACLGNMPSNLPAESLLIGPGDQLHVQVFETPELAQRPRVTDAGDIPMLLLGNIHLVGMTPAEAAAKFEKI